MLEYSLTNKKLQIGFINELLYMDLQLSMRNEFHSKLFGTFNAK